MIRVDSLVKVDLFVLIGLIDSNNQAWKFCIFWEPGSEPKKVQEPKKKEEKRGERETKEKRGEEKKKANRG